MRGGGAAPSFPLSSSSPAGVSRGRIVGKAIFVLHISIKLAFGSPFALRKSLKQLFTKVCVPKMEFWANGKSVFVLHISVKLAFSVETCVAYKLKSHRSHQSKGGGTAPHGVCDPWARWPRRVAGVVISGWAAGGLENRKIYFCVAHKLKSHIGNDLCIACKLKTYALQSSCT